MKKVSIIVPVYNEERYLERCLDSILNQKHKNIEILLINDGSDDNSPMICRKYATNNTNIIFISQENEGPGPTRNKGIELATGDFIGFVDADDFIHEDMYSVMVKEAEKNNADIVQCGYFRCDEEGKTPKEVNFTDSVEQIEGSYNCSFEYTKQDKINNFLCNKIFRKELFQNVKIPPLFAAEDQCALTKLFYNCEKLLIIPNAYYYYATTPQSLCRANFNVKKLDNIRGGKLMYEFHKEGYADLACFSSLMICSYIAQCYAYINGSEIEEKEIIIEEMITDFKFHYEISKNSVAFKYASRNRRFLIQLFRFNPKLSSFLFRLYNSIAKRQLF